MRAAVEGLAALIGCAFSWNSDRHKDFAVEAALPNSVIAIVGQKDRLIGTYRCAVRSFKNTVSPSAQKITVSIEDDDGMLSSCEAVNLILSVHGHGCHFIESPAVGQGAPVFDHFILVITASNNDAHGTSSKFILPSSRFLLRTRNWQPETPALFMLVHLPPCLETAAHARSMGEAVVDEKGGRTQTAIPMVAIDNHLFGFIGALQELLDVAVVQTDGPGNMRLFV